MFADFLYNIFILKNLKYVRQKNRQKINLWFPFTFPANSSGIRNRILAAPDWIALLFAGIPGVALHGAVKGGLPYRQAVSPQSPDTLISGW